MKIRRRVIWLTILALMLLGAWYDRLGLGSFFLLWFAGAMLVKVFDPDPVPTPKAPVEPEEDDLQPDDVIRVRRKAIEQIRNSLLRHHNSRGTDQAYQTSAAAKETTAIIQVLNAALCKKVRRLSA